MPLPCNRRSGIWKNRVEGVCACGVDGVLKEQGGFNRAEDATRRPDSRTHASTQDRSRQAATALPLAATPGTKRYSRRRHIQAIDGEEHDMQIKIEIDVKPEELRRFLGLPDVSGIQDEIISFLRDKVGQASEFGGGFVKSNLDVLKNIVTRSRSRILPRKLRQRRKCVYASGPPGKAESFPNKKAAVE